MGLFKKENKAGIALSDGCILNGKDPAAAEAYNLLRANLTAAIGGESGAHIVGVTSPDSGEGKSMTSINLAVSLARAGRKTLLLEGNMRTPSLAQALGISAGKGLAEVLGGTAASAEEVTSAVAGCDGLSVICCGSVPQNADQLICSDKTAGFFKEIGERYEYVIVDLPAVCAVPDAVSLSKWLSGVLVVVRGNATTQPRLADTLRQLQLAGVRMLGFVYNAAEGTKYGKY